MTTNYLVCNIEGTKSREQNKETCFFFCRDAVSSPFFDGKVTKITMMQNKKNVIFSLGRVKKSLPQHAAGTSQM